MKILHIVPTYFPARRYGGPIESVHHLCKSLVKRGHAVEVYTTNVDGPYNSEVPLQKPVNRDGVLITYHRVKCLRKIYYSPQLEHSLKKNVHNYDVIHNHSIFLWPTLIAARIAEKKGIPYIISPRGMLNKSLFARKSGLLKNIWVNILERRSIEKASGVHVTSEIEIKEIRKFGFNLPKVFVIPNPFDFATFTSTGGEIPKDIRKTMKDNHCLLFIGRINWKKGLDRLILTMVNLPEVHLIIAGNDEDTYKVYLNREIERHHMADRVHWIGPCYGQAKLELLKMAKIFVLPSYSENFGNTVMEAMAAGCPVLVTPEVGISNIVSKSVAGVVCSGNSDVLARKVKDLLSKPLLLNEMGKCGQAAVGRYFDSDLIAKAMEIAYLEVITKIQNIR